MLTVVIKSELAKNVSGHCNCKSCLSMARLLKDYLRDLSLSDYLCRNM